MSAAEVVRCFKSMNTDVEAVICAPREQHCHAKQALDDVASLFRNVESTLSRFVPDSDLSDLNHAAGQSYKATPMLLQVVSLSLQMAEMTGGVFDPTILPSLIASGYDRSFETLSSSAEQQPSCQHAPDFTWRDVVVNHDRSTIQMPIGCGIDLGGIGKGWAVDQACRLLCRFPSFAVDAGGDIRVKGRKIDGKPWTIGISNPFVPGRDMSLIESTCGAICTSTTTRRRWQMSGSWQHHLIDTRTGRPVDSDVVLATVTAPTCASAEVIAKASLILGSDEGMRLIDSQRCASGLLVLQDGVMVSSAGFKEIQNVA